MPWIGKGRSDVPRTWAAALEQVLEALDPTRQVAEFVLTGQHVEALNKLSGGYRWRLQAGHWTSAAEKKAMTTLYAGFGEVDAAVLRRWGRVLDAAWGAHGWGLTLGDVAGCHWPELMLRQAAASHPSAPLPVTFADLERIAAADGTPPAALVRMAFTLAPYSRYQHQVARGYLQLLPGFADAVVTHRDVAASALVSGSADERVAAAALLGLLGDTVLTPLAEPLAEAATTTSAKVRDAASPLVARLGGAAAGPLRRLATGSEPERRGYALHLLAARPDQRAWAIHTASSDRAASVRALGARWEAAHTPEATAADSAPELPPLPPLPSWALAGADAERVAASVFKAVCRGVESRNRSMRARRQANPNHPLFRESTAPPSFAGRLARLLAADGPARIDDKLDGMPAPMLIARDVADAISKNGYPAGTAIQVMAALGWLDLPQHGRGPWVEVIAEVHARTGGPDLLTVQRMLDAVGADGRALVWSAYSTSWGPRIGRDWPDDHVGPFVAHNLDWIVRESSAHQGWGIDEQAHFAAIATLPRPPAWLVDRLYALAVGTRKTDREPAQAALERDPQRAARAADALQDGKGEVRLAAAQWLTRIADPAVLPALRAAWKKENQDVVRGALLDALIAIGEDAGSYLDPAATEATAAKFVASGLPSSLAWLDWAALPELTWASSHETVSRAVVQWLCGTAVKAKSPEPDAVLRHYAALFDATGRERLAAHLLAGWLREDLRPISPAEAESRAARAASSYFGWYSSQNGPYAGMSVQQVKAAILASYVNLPVGSATASKGLLAVAAACGGRDVVPPAERYLTQWYGQRAAQGKALIAMLSWVDHPNATQLVLAIGSRFRTKGIQEEAATAAKHDMCFFDALVMLTEGRTWIPAPG